MEFRSFLSLICAALSNSRLPFLSLFSSSSLQSLLFFFFFAFLSLFVQDAVVYVVAGGRAGLKIFFYFCFFACSSVFVILYVCLVDPSFNLDVVANFV